MSRRVTLRAKLLVATACVASATIAFLLGYFGPHTERSFVDRSESLIAKGSEAMRDMARSHVADNGEILVQLIQHSADARRRALQDIPLSLYGADIERIRDAIEEQDSARASRLLANVQALGRELERRGEKSIGRHVEQLRGELGAMSETFGSDLRSSYLLLTGGMLAGLIGLLILGLDRFIVRPVHNLRNATRRIAAGELDVRVENRSKDELGDLAGDFAVMVGQLRASRDEIREKNAQLESWNETLQQEVQRKTSHLEDALRELQSAQRGLLQADKMASIGTLAGGIAHEFNNLIGGIRGCIDDAMKDEDPAQRHESLEVALRAAERATVITAKLLQFARPKIDSVETVSIRNLVGEVVELVEPQARRQGVTVETRVPAELFVVVDPGGMHQVFLNLFTNALQAMPDGGRLAVDASDEDGRIEVRVADTGVGIPREEVDHVFDPFYSSKSRAAKPEKRGSGLGLSVSYGIVEAHGGTLGVESRPGEGSTFTVTLPRAEVGGGTA